MKAFYSLLFALLTVLPLYGKVHEAAPQEITDSADECILLISIPKAGTHLMGNLLQELEGKSFYSRGHERDHHNLFPTVDDIITFHEENKISYLHMPYSQSAAQLFVSLDIKLFFIYRDPRDQLLSAIHGFRDLDEWIKSLDAKIYYYINECSYNAFGEGIQPGVYGLYESFMPWAFDENVCAVRFEDLVGVEGGGTQERQAETIRRVAAHLGKYLTDEEVEVVASKIFGGTRTFFKGQIGRWKSTFREGHKKAFKTSPAGQLLIEYGFEETNDW